MLAQDGRRYEAIVISDERKTTAGEPRRAVSTLEALRRFPERGQEEAIGLPQGLTGRLGRRMEMVKPRSRRHEGSATGGERLPDAPQTR